MGKSEDNRYYMVRGNWDPLARGFKELTHLNEETPKGMSNTRKPLIGIRNCFFFLFHFFSFYGFVQISGPLPPAV
jgi:hypothetical protein